MADARIFDTGYRAYEGPRGGLGHTTWSTTRHAIERTLGIRRTIWQKLLPVIVIAMSFLPAIVFVGLVALFPADIFDEPITPDYVDYYAFVTSAIVLFTALVAPEVLCTDRRTGMLGLYLASPLDRMRYVVAKFSAVVLVLSVVTILPLVLLLVAYTIEGVGPDGVIDVGVVLGRAVAAGLVMSVFYAALSLMVSSLTDRRAFASAGIVLILVLSAAVADSLVEHAELSPFWYLLDMIGLPVAVVWRIWGETLDNRSSELATVWVVGATMGWIALFLAVIAGRYRSLRVSR